MATKKATENVSVVIPAIQIKELQLKIVGDSPFISHAWSEKARKQMLDSMMKVAKTAKEPKRPMQEFADSLYWVSEKPDFDGMKDEEIYEAVMNGRFGFPSTAFKAAAVAGVYRAKLAKDMVSMRGAFHIQGELVEIDGVPEMIEDPVRVAKGGTDLRYRGKFEHWSAILDIRYNAGVLSVEQIANALNLGGFACGIGDWRIEKGGQYGAFHVE